MKVKFWIDENEKPVYKSFMLSTAQGNELKKSKNKLSSILKWEELYDQIIESHLAFKAELYSSALSRIGNVRLDYITNHETRSKLNRLIFNTLNMSKLYLDKHYYEHKKGTKITKIKCYAKDITNSDKAQNEIKLHRETIYEISDSYRLGGELRRIAQHSTLPVKNMSSGFTNNSQDKKSEINSHFNLPIQKQELLDCGANKALLNKFNETIDLHEVMDEYIYRISEMHDLNRKLTKGEIEIAKRVFINLCKDTESNYGKSKFGFNVHENEEPVFSLELDWFEVVDYLQSKHAFPINHRIINHNTYLTEQQKTR